MARVHFATLFLVSCLWALTLMGAEATPRLFATSGDVGDKPVFGMDTHARSSAGLEPTEKPPPASGLEAPSDNAFCVVYDNCQHTGLVVETRYPVLTPEECCELCARVDDSACFAFNFDANGCELFRDLFGTSPDWVFGVQCGSLRQRNLQAMPTEEKQQ